MVTSWTSRADFLADHAIVQLTGNQYTTRHFSGGRNGELQYDFSLQDRVFSQGAIVDAMDGTLVTVEYHLNFFDTATGRALSPATATRAACRGVTRRAMNLCY